MYSPAFTYAPLPIPLFFGWGGFLNECLEICLGNIFSVTWFSSFTGGKQKGREQGNDGRKKGVDS